MSGAYKPEGKIVWAPGAFTSSLPDMCRDMISEAERHGKDIEVTFQHRAAGAYEIRARIVEPGRRCFELPPMVFVP